MTYRILAANEQLLSRAVVNERDLGELADVRPRERLTGQDYNVVDAKIVISYSIDGATQGQIAEAHGGAR